MKRVFQFLFAAMIVWIVLDYWGVFATQDVMETKLNARDIDEYSRSVLQIVSGIKNLDERGAFASALVEIGLGSEMLNTRSTLRDELLKKCHDKTPYEIIQLAEDERDAKRKLAAQRAVGIKNFQLDNFTVKIEDDEIYLFPKTSEAEYRRREIAGTLKEIEMFRKHWLVTTKQDTRSKAVPTIEEINQLYGWPAASQRIEGAEYFYLEDGSGACRYQGKVYTLKSPELHATGDFP